MTQSTIMEQEALQASEAIERQLVHNSAIMQELCARLKSFGPSFVMTIGRGSSDHAATFAKYLFETKLGWVTASAAPSVVTLYHAPLALAKALVVGISQSGQSPDICQTMRMARQCGAVTVAIVNVVNSPLAEAAEFVIPMWAGEEKAVAATKSYLASLGVILNLVAELSGDAKLADNFARLPRLLLTENRAIWPAFGEGFGQVRDTLVIGRGYGFPIALELALKFKETAAIQAEAFSAAELLHGPLALIRSKTPYLLLAQRDQTKDEILALAAKIKHFGGRPFLIAGSGIAGVDELQACTDAFFLAPGLQQYDPLLDPILLVQIGYLLIARLAVERGANPDAPARLSKVTETL